MPSKINIRVLCYLKGERTTGAAMPHTSDAVVATSTSLRAARQAIRELFGTFKQIKLFGDASVHAMAAGGRAAVYIAFTLYPIAEVTDDSNTSSASRQP